MYIYIHYDAKLANRYEEETMHKDYSNERSDYPNPVYDPGDIMDRNHSIPGGPEIPHIETEYIPTHNDHIAESYQDPWRRSETHTEGWREPSYSEQREPMRNMYSPGICVNPPYPRRRVDEIEQMRAPRERGRKFLGFLRAVCLVFVCSVFSGAAAYFVMEYRFNRGDFIVNNQVVLGGSNSEAQQDGGFTTPVVAFEDSITAQDIYDMACSQVVGINTEAPSLGGGFGTQGPVSPVSGSGFIISSDGYILTNYHVIELAHTNGLNLSVTLNDGTSYDAKIIGFEASNDVAVVKINATGLNPTVIGNSDNIRVGQTIYAVGNPFGDLVYTMTDGIVSALDRVVSVERKSINTFQFSAAVNSGNSGGPIYDTTGEVIGIVTAKLIRGNVEGIGFAIPINDAIEIASELIEHGYVAGRPFMGIGGNTVTSAHAEYWGWVVGVYIRSVTPDSAADKAGLVVGDIITSLDGVDIDSMDSLKFAMRSYKAGDTTTLTAWRNGVFHDLTITFDEDLSAGQPQQRESLPERDTPYE